ncbi:MAG: response regulator, partial [Wenzhouxiangella sp.]
MAELLVEKVSALTGARCQTASTLAETRALMASGAAAFDVAVLDLNLPDARDLDVINVVLGAGIPAIVLTGSEDLALRQALLDRGVSDYVRKDSVGVDYVARQIRRMLRAEDNRILVVDDSRSYRQHLCALLAQHGYSVIQADDGAAGLAALKHDDSIRMVITDYHMPRMDGLQMTAAMRRLKSHEQLAIIALSQSGGPELLARFLKGGASDFLHKSFSTEELFCRVDQNIDMLLSLAEARHASNHDYLTGLPNRRDFMRRASPVHEAAVSDSSGLVVAILDADHFKQINDQFGHHFGDLALVAMADALREAAGTDGLCARMGGEEFAILLPRYSQAQAEAVLEAHISIWDIAALT